MKSPVIHEERQRLRQEVSASGTGSASTSTNGSGSGSHDHTEYSRAGYGAVNQPEVRVAPPQPIFRQHSAPISGLRSSLRPSLRPNFSVDEFTDNADYLQNKIMRTGRQRKKLAARSKGGEFQQRRKKRRVYFCCVSSEIDIEKLHDVFDKRSDNQWESRMYEDVLHLFHNVGNPDPQESTYFEGSPDFNEDPYAPTVENQNQPAATTTEGLGGIPLPEGEGGNGTPAAINEPDGSLRPGGTPTVHAVDPQSASRLWLTGGKEVFIFDFGAIVFWGFHRGEEEELLNEIRFFVVTHGSGGLLSHQEFEEGQDDMAFVTSPDITAVTIANDVITLPDDASAKSRLSVSFAIAQSTVLAIFEARIERKIEDYKYIPETLADRGKLKLSTKQLGGMIGEVYVIRHDVNLHSEILDTPDFFWKEPAAVEEDYRLTMRYLEMDTRTEILNKRLDMLRELLQVLQQQHENGHAMKLEWIVIWLIIVSTLVELVDIVMNAFYDKY